MLSWGGRCALRLDSKRQIGFTTRIKRVDCKTRTVQFEVSAKGTGVHKLAFRTFNGTVADPARHLDFRDGQTADLRWELQVEDPDKPWVVVIAADGDLAGNQELTGTLIGQRTLDDVIATRR